MRYYNRELSWLEFNARVLEEAQDRKNPVFERLKFLAITSNNLDEFFMVRVSSLWALVEAGHEARDAAGLTPEEQLVEISKKVHGFVHNQYNCLNRSILPQLEKEGYSFILPQKSTQSQQDFIRQYFMTTVFPILTPMAIDRSRPFPLLLNKTLNIIVQLESEDDEEEYKYAVVQVPSVEKRFLELPREEGKGRQFALLEEIIKLYLPRLFEGHKVKKSFCFRITRNSDLELQEDDYDDLLVGMEKSIQKRKWGEPNRLETEKAIDADVLDYLCESLDFDGDEVYKISGIIDFTMFFSFYDKGEPSLKDLPLEPQPGFAFKDKEEMFALIREKDYLVHHPYESFDCVVKFVTNAAADPAVLAIKQTLYRVSGNSPIIQALINAAMEGKQVTVLVEIKARFDEENNIIWARKLEKAGCHVIYGLVGLKTHCKMCLVVRKEEDGIRRYIHLGTGNYNDSTAKIYTDLSFFTRKETFGADISALFNTLTGYSLPPEWKKIAVAPTSLRATLESWIDSEIESAREGADARIIVKINSLVDQKMIDKLYEAGNAGVKIDLIVRGVCCLRAQVKGLSENIRVISIIDRFLEHSRIYYFENGGEPKIYLSSADLMPRNLDRRVEVAFPIEQEDLKEYMKNLLKMTLMDTEKARYLKEDGTYGRVSKRRSEPFHSQMEFHKDAVRRFEESAILENDDLFVPITSVLEEPGSVEDITRS